MKSVWTLLLSAALLSTSFNAYAFKPFRGVPNVCPDCTQPPSDKVTLASGNVLLLKIVAENPDFLIGMQNGQVRASILVFSIKHRPVLSITKS